MSQLRIAPATKAYIAVIPNLIQALAEYERLASHGYGKLFGHKRAAEVLLAQPAIDLYNRLGAVSGPNTGSLGPPLKRPAH